MHRKFVPFVISAGLFAAQDVTWQAKPLAQWSEEDARQVLTTVSPWTKIAPATLVRQPTEDQQRQAGRMGGGVGIGVEALVPTTLFGGKQQTEVEWKSAANLVIRWESAAPIRSAEGKLGGRGVWGDYYAIEVYGVPTAVSGLDVRSHVHNLKKLGVLKRPGKQDLAPVRIEILPESNELVNVVYLFPRSEPITTEDKSVEFVLHLGRIFVTQDFYPAQMQYQGKLEL